MKTYTVDLTLSIDAMNEESADNKLDAFLSALDLKKNDKIELVSCGDLSEGGSSKKEDDDDDAAIEKTADPEQALPENWKVLDISD